jgi:hypothetical protein
MARFRATYLVAVACLASCKGDGKNPWAIGSGSSGAVSVATSTVATSGSADAAQGSGTTEKLTPRTIVDSQQGGMTLGVVAAPEHWTLDAKPQWNYANTSNAFTLALTFHNPDNAEAVFMFPVQLHFALRPGGAYYKPGQAYGGLVYGDPRPPLDTLVSFIQRTRSGVTNLKFIGNKDLPDLAAALKIPPAKNQHGIGVKVAYELDGKPCEEEFYAVYDLVNIPYDGPRGRTWQINWGLEGTQSFRAPAGTLDQRRPLFAEMAKSFRPNPAWQARAQAVNKYLADQFNRQLKLDYDQIAAAGRLSRQLTANSNAFLANVDRQLAASRAAQSPSATAESRSAGDKFDDYVRGVDTVDDPVYGTSQHSSSEQYHWTDGYGTYRNSNDASYDPNHHEVGSWTLMPATP